MKTKQKAAIHTWMMSASSIEYTTEPRPRVLGGPNGSRYGDELLDLVVICHGACRGQGQLLRPSNPRLESLIGFKRRWSSCTWNTWHPRDRRKKGPCTSGRIRRHLDGFRRFMVHLNHNKVFTAVCEAKLRPWCNHVISFAISHASSWFIGAGAGHEH